MEVKMHSALLILLVVVLWYQFCVFWAALYRVQEVGLKALAGPRDDLPPMGVKASRADRALNNLKENLFVFIPLVLLSVHAGASGMLAPAGALIFFVGRLLHFPLYVFGVQYARSAVFHMSLAGNAILLVSIFLAIL